ALRRAPGSIPTAAAFCSSVPFPHLNCRMVCRQNTTRETAIRTKLLRFLDSVCEKQRIKGRSATSSSSRALLRPEGQYTVHDTFSAIIFELTDNGATADSGGDSSTAALTRASDLDRRRAIYDNRIARWVRVRP